MPAELAGVKIEEKLGGQLDLTQTVTTEKGEKVDPKAPEKEVGLV